MSNIIPPRCIIYEVDHCKGPSLKSCGADQMVVSVQGMIVLNMTISSFTAEVLRLTTPVYEVWIPGGFGGRCLGGTGQTLCPY